MDKLKIALLQISPSNSTEENLKIGITRCREAYKKGVDIILFPEMWNCGYDFYENKENLEKIAVTLDSEYVVSFQKLAKELNVAIGITMLLNENNKFFNTVLLIDRFGEIILKYSKVHTCDFTFEKILDSGDQFVVSKLNTIKGYINIGAMICYDREFPESARILMLKNAELILVPNACTMEINRLSQLRSRAYENMLAIATCNYPTTHPNCNGHSSLFDGVARIPKTKEAREMCLLEADENQGIYISEIDVDLLREYRKNGIHGNAYRKPFIYNDLLSSEVSEPFIRTPNN